MGGQQVMTFKIAPPERKNFTAKEGALDRKGSQARSCRGEADLVNISEGEGERSRDRFWGGLVGRRMFSNNEFSISI